MENTINKCTKNSAYINNPKKNTIHFVDYNSLHYLATHLKNRQKKYQFSKVQQTVMISEKRFDRIWLWIVFDF